MKDEKTDGRILRRANVGGGIECSMKSTERNECLLKKQNSCVVAVLYFIIYGSAFRAT